MASKRSYDDGCAAAHALDLIGERWALLVVREVLPGVAWAGMALAAAGVAIATLWPRR